MRFVLKFYWNNNFQTNNHRNLILILENCKVILTQSVKITCKSYRNCFKSLSGQKRFLATSIKTIAWAKISQSLICSNGYCLKLVNKLSFYSFYLQSSFEIPVQEKVFSIWFISIFLIQFLVEPGLR